MKKKKLINNYNNIDWIALDQFSINKLSSDMEKDRFYRIYHNSNKMYDFIEISVEMWNDMLKILNKNFHEKKLDINVIIAELEKMDCSLLLLKQFKEVQKISNIKKLDPKTQTIDSFISFSFYEMTKQIIESTLTCLRQAKNNQGWLWQDDRSVMSKDEMIMSSVFQGLSIRMVSLEIKKEIRDSIFFR